MQKDTAKELDVFAKEIARRFSNKNRSGAVINFKKSTGKIGVAFCYYIKSGMSKGWKYFFPTDSHLNGFQAFLYYKLEAERKNYDKNFATQNK